jgi:hypothetical protein
MHERAAQHAEHGRWGGEALSVAAAECMGRSQQHHAAYRAVWAHPLVLLFLAAAICCCSSGLLQCRCLLVGSGASCCCGFQWQVHGWCVAIWPEAGQHRLTGVMGGPSAVHPLPAAGTQRHHMAVLRIHKHMVSSASDVQCHPLPKQLLCHCQHC